MSEAEPEQTYQYSLTADDLLAWLSLPQDGALAAILLWTAPAGLTLGILPESLVGAPWQPRFFIAGAILLALWYVFFKLAIRQVRIMRARKAIPAPVGVTLQEWDDHLAELWSGGGRTIRPAEIAEVKQTAGHVFVRARADMIIVPLAAFADGEAMRAFARRWDSRAKNAEPAS